MKIQNRFLLSAIQSAFVLAFLFSFPNNSFAQVQVGVTVNSGVATTTCGDIFSAADPRWAVRVGTGAWNNFTNDNSNTNCFSTFPSIEWAFPFNCQNDIPSSLQVCFRAYEDDGIGGCNINETCLEEICQNFIVPPVGSIQDYTLALPAGGDSGGQLEFSIGVIGTLFESLNDEICNAEDFGVIPSGTTVGDASIANYNNICGTNTGEVNPSDDGFWVNDKGIWFQFTTSSNPGYEILIEAESDPQNMGNALNMEMALYESDDETCNGNLTLVDESFIPSTESEFMVITCPEPDKTYFVLLDGLNLNNDLDGFIGFQVTDVGTTAGAETRCEAYDLGMIPTGGQAGVVNFHNVCANNIGDPNPSAFISQRSVWFTFQAPPSGSVLVEVLSVDGAPNFNGIGAQIGVYRSFSNSCAGFFMEVGSSFSGMDEDESIELNCLEPGDSYWVLVDGSGSNTAGIFDLNVIDQENYPPQTTIDTTLCFGTSIAVGNANYSTTGDFTYVFNLPNGCDSTVYTNVIIADLLEVTAEQATLASSMTASDGAVIANPTGGNAPYTYQWSNGNVTNPLNDNVPAGNYCVTVTDASNCTAEDCVNLEFALITATATGDVLDCFGDLDGTLSFTAEDGSAPYNFSYSNSLGTISDNGTILNDGDLIQVNNLPAGNYQVNIEDAAGNMTFASAVISEPAEITFDQDYTLCFGDSIVIGNEIYNTSGPISEIIQSSNGCDSIVTGTVTILPDPSVTIDSTICFGEMIMIENSTYSNTGTYLDTVINLNGCDSIITTNLTVLDEIVASILVNTLPSGFNQNNGTAAVQASGGSGGYTYLWSNGQTGAVAVDLIGGTNYCVTVTDENECTQESCTLILYENNIALTANDTLDCNGDMNGQISLAVANGLGDYNYTWENTETGVSGTGTITGNFGIANITNLEKGDYNITVTDTYVSQVLSVQVIEPLPLEIQLLTNQSISCEGECDGGVVLNPTGGTAPYTYNWSGEIAAVADPSNLCPTDYSVTVTDINGCSSIATINIPEPTSFSASISEIEAISCGGETDGVLNAIPMGGTGTNYTYLWSNQDNQSIAAGLGSGIYTVTVSDGVGCTTTSSYSLSQPIPVSFDLNITDVDCRNGLNSGIVVIENTTGGTAPYGYSIGQNSYNAIPSFGQLSAGSYQIYVRDANGCIENQVAIVDLPEQVEVNLGDDYEIRLGETIEISANTNSTNAYIEWNIDSCQNCPTLEVTPINSTAYEVTVLDTITGCSNSDMVNVFVSKERRVFIPNAFSPDGDGANDFLTIFGDANSIQSVKNFRVFNRWGAMVFEKENLIFNEESEGWNGYFNNRKLQTGVYIYLVEIEFIDGEVEVFRGDVTLMN